MARREREPRHGTTYRVQRRIDEARRLLVDGMPMPELIRHLCGRYGVKEAQSRSYINGAIEDMRARDAICPDAAISRLLYQERLLGEFRELGKLSRSRKGNGHRVSAIKARVEIADRLADLDGVAPRDPGGDDGGGFTLVLDLDPEPGGADAS